MCRPRSKRHLHILTCRVRISRVCSSLPQRRCPLPQLPPPAQHSWRHALLLELRSPPAHLLSLIGAAHLPSQVGDSTDAPPLVSLQARQPVRAARVHTTAVRPLRAGWPRGRFARVARGPAPSSGCAATHGSARQARRGLGRAEAGGAVDSSHAGDSWAILGPLVGRLGPLARRRVLSRVAWVDLEKIEIVRGHILGPRWS